MAEFKLWAVENRHISNLRGAVRSLRDGVYPGSSADFRYAKSSATDPGTRCDWSIGGDESQHKGALVPGWSALVAPELLLPITRGLLAQLVRCAHFTATLQVETSGRRGILSIRDGGVPGTVSSRINRRPGLLSFNFPVMRYSVMDNTESWFSTVCVWVVSLGFFSLIWKVAAHFFE